MVLCQAGVRISPFHSSHKCACIHTIVRQQLSSEVLTVVLGFGVNMHFDIINRLVSFLEAHPMLDKNQILRVDVSSVQWLLCTVWLW